VRGRIAQAALQAGRSPEEVRLVAVSKEVPPEAIRAAYKAGLRYFGESRLQEAQGKAQALRDLPIRWHMVGHLQSNKAKHAVGLFELIHSVDSLKLLQLLQRHAQRQGKVQEVLLQVKLVPEPTKHGLSVEELKRLLQEAQGMEHIRVRGLMCIPPYSPEPEDSRPFYQRLRALRDGLQAEGFELPELSMGMSGDYEVAVQEGATMVRVGTAIFGERPR